MIYLFKKRNLLGSIQAMVDPLLHTDNWLLSLVSSSPRTPINFTVNDINPENPFKPPIYKNMRGRPKKLAQNRENLPKRSRSNKDIYLQQLHAIELGLKSKKKKTKNI